MTDRAWTAYVTTAVLLLTVAAPPIVHVHEVSADADHHHGTARVHAHAADHDHAPVDRDQSPDDSVWNIDGVVSQPIASAAAPLPALAAAVIDVDPGRVRLDVVDRADTRVHDPPRNTSSALRAPPSVLPVLS